MMRLQIVKTSPQTLDQFVQVTELTNALQKQYNLLVQQYLVTNGNTAYIKPSDLSLEMQAAQALIFFTDLSFNNTFVDASIRTNLFNFLQSRKDSKGGYLQTPGAQPIPDYVHNAFITYATIYHNSAVNVVAEITALKLVADSQVKLLTVDAYFLALLSNTLYALRRGTEAQVYTDVLVKLQRPDGSLFTNSTLGVTYSGSTGYDYTLQTTSLALLAWNNTLARYTASVTNATNYLYN